MRIAIVGQQQFGNAVLDAFMRRGHDVAGVFCAPNKAGAKPDELCAAAQQQGVPVYQFDSLRGDDALRTLRDLRVDLSVMAYVLQFAPQEFIGIPRFGTIQFHPSLLPRYRGPSAISWPIIRGDQTTGLTIFRPTDGLDEGPVILQKEIAIGPDDTLGDVYFTHLFPSGVTALLEAAVLVGEGGATEIPQDESQASYEGWCRAAESRINWHNHVDLTYNLIRGCNPSPGAWTLFNNKKLQLFDVRKHPTRTASQAKNSVGSVTAIGNESFCVMAHGGLIEVLKVRYDGHEKISAAQFCAEAGLCRGTILGS